MQNCSHYTIDEEQSKRSRLKVEHFDEHCIKNIKISIVNQKGGCGKTTTAVNLSACLAWHGYKVLLIDMDSQAQATLSLKQPEGRRSGSLYDVFRGKTGMKQIVAATAVDNLDIVPSDIFLSGAELSLMHSLGRESLLKAALNNFLKEVSYHYIIIDCSPALNLLTLNALAASHYTLIPFQTQYYSLEGMRELMATIDSVKDKLNPDLEILGLLGTMYDQRINNNRSILRQVHNFFKGQVFKTAIRINTKLSEAPMYKKSILDYDRNSNGARDYLALTQEVIDRTTFHATKLILRN